MGQRLKKKPGPTVWITPLGLKYDGVLLKRWTIILWLIF